MAAKIITFAYAICILFLLDSAGVSRRLLCAQLKSLDSLVRTVSPQDVGEECDLCFVQKITLAEGWRMSCKRDRSGVRGLRNCRQEEWRDQAKFEDCEELSLTANWTWAVKEWEEFG